MSRKSIVISSIVAMIGWMALTCGAHAQGMDYRQAVQLGKAAYGGGLVELAQLKAAAQTGSVAAETVLGSLYQVGLSRNDMEAAKWFGKAAEQGEPEAQFGLGAMYANGYGMPQDFAAAARWFKKAAEQGNPAPNFYLGLFYENGLGVARNYAEAAKWYAKAAGVPEPVGLQFDLAVKGGGNGPRSPEDSSQVINVFPPVPEQPQAGAAYNLGLMCWNGRGQPKNDVDAYKWFVVADSHGNHLAKYNMVILSRKMSQKQISDALAQATQWEREHPLRNANKLSLR